MIDSEVIIIGAGPAGSTCAWKLKESGFPCLILDKNQFPRRKLCAGWITPEVFKDIGIDIHHSPFPVKTFRKIYVHIHNKCLEMNSRQHSIRRYEFDAWLLKRSGVPVITHHVKNIVKQGEFYIIDNQYRCKYLIGAGGTHCPVYQLLFRKIYPRKSCLKIVALDLEFPFHYNDENCYLWFFQDNLPGYSWYVPKPNDYLNIGIGGFSEKFKDNHDTITHQWLLFMNKLKKMSLLEDYPPHPRGYVYYMRDDDECVQHDRAFLLGDAAGLATKDMGQGIGPAIKSGLLAAEAIIKGKPYSVKTIHRYTNQRYRVFMQLMDFFQR